MQPANKALRKDIPIFKSKDVPSKMKCQRLVDHVYAVFAFVSEKLVVDHTNDGKDHKQKKRDLGRMPHANVQYGKENMGVDMGLPSQ